MRIVSWNVNSLRAREARVAAYLDAQRPDVLCLQETKVEDGLFPRDLFESRGYAVEFAGQKTYNGVAIASRLPLEDVWLRANRAFAHRTSYISSRAPPRPRQHIALPPRVAGAPMSDVRRRAPAVRRGPPLPAA